jgi:hypothetical protein
VPDFRVVSLRAEEVKVPLGVVPRGDGSVTVTLGNRSAHRALRTARRDGPGHVWIQVTDPGWRRADGREQRGVMRWVQLKKHGSSSRGGLHESRVLIEGPAWDHLPAEVVLHFEDGVEVRERWDGKAAWRGYRAVRGAPLQTVHIDRARRLLVDVRPQNNSLAREPDRRFTADWGGWLGALAQWLAEAVSLWL